MKMGLSTSQSCIKYCLFIFNLIFFITGIILIAIGASASSAFYSYDTLLKDKFLSLPSFIIAVGIIIVIVAFFGCCGSIKENNCMILTFSICMILIFILEFSGAIAGFVLKNETHELIRHEMNISMSQFGKSNTTKAIWDTIQIEFNCCGIDNKNDWAHSSYPGTAKGDLPISCCQNDDTNWIGEKICNVNSTNIWDVGCLTAFANAMQDNAASLGAGAIVISIIQFFGVCLSCYLAKAIRNQHQQF